MFTNHRAILRSTSRAAGSAADPQHTELNLAEFDMVRRPYRLPHAHRDVEKREGSAGLKRSTGFPPIKRESSCLGVFRFCRAEMAEITGTKAVTLRCAVPRLRRLERITVRGAEEELKEEE